MRTPSTRHRVHYAVTLPSQNDRLANHCAFGCFRIQAAAINRAADGIRRAALQLFHRGLDDLGCHLARRILGLLRHHTAQHHEVSDQVHVGFDGGEERR